MLVNVNAGNSVRRLLLTTLRFCPTREALVIPAIEATSDISVAFNPDLPPDLPKFGSGVKQPRALCIEHATESRLSHSFAEHILHESARRLDDVARSLARFSIMMAAARGIQSPRER